MACRSGIVPDPTVAPGAKDGCESVIAKPDLGSPSSPGRDSRSEDRRDFWRMVLGDYRGLVRQCVLRATLHPGSLFHQVNLAEALVLAGHHERALALLTELHHRAPAAPDVQALILDVLRRQGRDVDDFEWIERPPLLRLDEPLLARCVEIIQTSRRPQSLPRLTGALACDGYCCFNDDELIAACRDDPRFLVSGTAPPTVDVRGPGSSSPCDPSLSLPTDHGSTVPE